MADVPTQGPENDGEARRECAHVEVERVLWWVSRTQRLNNVNGSDWVDAPPPLVWDGIQSLLKSNLTLIVRYKNYSEQVLVASILYGFKIGNN